MPPASGACRSDQNDPTRRMLNIISQLCAESPIAGNATHSSPLAGGPIRRVFLAPEPKRFLRGTVGIAEQDAFALGHNVIGRPRRHHEDIMRFEGKIARPWPSTTLNTATAGMPSPPCLFSTTTG